MRSGGSSSRLGALLQLLLAAARGAADGLDLSGDGFLSSLALESTALSQIAADVPCLNDLVSASVVHHF